MTEPAHVAPHVTDDDIDAYWRRALAPDDEARVERHYLACPECEKRVRLVETLVDALRDDVVQAPLPVGRDRVWQATAAAMAALAIGAGFGWARARDAGGPIAALTAPRSSIVGPLSPPTRDGSAAPVAMLTDTPVITFELDAREAGAAGARFDVSLAHPDGQVILRMRRIASTDNGMVTVPVPRSMLGPGTFVFEVANGSTVVTIPVVFASP